MDNVREVKVLVTEELARALEDWSDPVQVRIMRNEASETGWEMIARTVNLEDLRAP